MVFCWDEGELVLCGRMVQGRWSGWKGECWGLVLGILGGGGGGGRKICVYVFFFRVGERFWSACLLQNGSRYYGRVGWEVVELWLLGQWKFIGLNCISSHHQGVNINWRGYYQCNWLLISLGDSNCRDFWFGM